MNKKIFEEGIFVLARQFTEKMFDAQILWPFLKDLTDEQFTSAITKILTTTKDINKATNIIALVREFALQKEELLAGEAWENVLSEIHRVGNWREPVFKNTLVKKTVECIGWDNLCLSENIMIERAHFLKIYDQLKDRHQRESVELITHGPIKLLVDKIVDKR